MKHLIAIFCFATAAAGATIERQVDRLLLGTDANGGGHSITNLGTISSSNVTARSMTFNGVTLFDWPAGFTPSWQPGSNTAWQITGSNVVLQITGVLPNAMIPPLDYDAVGSADKVQSNLIAFASGASNTFLATIAWQSWLGTNGLSATAGDNRFTGSNSFPVIYFRTGLVTNIITRGVTNWIACTGLVMAYESSPGDPTVLGTNSVFLTEVFADETLRVAGTTNIIGDVLAVQDDVVLWTWGAPQNISGMYYDFEVQRVSDLTNITTTYGPIIFADGSQQTTAWSNSSAQIAPLGASIFDAIGSSATLGSNIAAAGYITGSDATNSFDAKGSSATVQSNLSAFAQYGATQTWTAAQLHIATNTFDAITFFNGPLFAFAHTNLYAYTAPNGTALRSLYHSRMSSASPLTTNQLLALFALTPYDKPLGAALGVIDSRPYAATNAPSLWVSGSNGVAGFWVLPNDIGGVDVGASRFVFTNPSPATVDVRTQQVAGVASLVCTVPGLSRTFSNVSGNLIGYLGGQVALATGSDNNGSSLTNFPASMTNNLPWCASYQLTTNAVSWTITGWPMVVGSKLTIEFSGNTTNASTAVALRYGGLASMTVSRHGIIQQNSVGPSYSALGGATSMSLSLSTTSSGWDGFASCVTLNYASAASKLWRFNNEYINAGTTNMYFGLMKVAETNAVTDLTFTSVSGPTLMPMTAVVTITPGGAR